jgi:hypothetical protein
MCQSSGCRDSRPEDPGQLLGHHSDPLFTATASGHADLRVDLRTSIATFVGLAGSALILQVAPWRLLWWVMTAITLAPLPPVAASLPAEAARGASGAAAAARRIGATVRSPLPWIAGLAFAVDWASMPAGAILQAGFVAAFSLCGAAIPAALFRIAMDLAPPAGSTPAVIGLLSRFP